MKLILQLLLIFASISICYSARCTSHPGPAKPNPYPILDGPMTLVKEIPNAKLYIKGDPSLNATIRVAHVWGKTFYDMGYLAGQLYGWEGVEFVNDIWSYIEGMVKENIPDYVPAWLADMIVKYGAGAAFDMTYLLTRPFTTKGYYDEL